MAAVSFVCGDDVMGDAVSQYSYMKTPVGILTIIEDGDTLVEIHFGQKDFDSAPPTENRTEVHRQLEEYFAGDRKTFSLRLAPHGTPFQLSVWNALRQIAYGKTRSYAEIAREIGRPAAVRAVGAANGANPIPIVIPCHRVVGSNGSLTGFGGGIDMKRALLDFEAGFRLL